MRNIWLVIKHEIRTTLRRRSFWIMTFLLPTLLLAINGYAAIQDNESRNGGDDEETSAAQMAEAPSIGLIDEAGLIAVIPEGIPPDMFVPFSDQASARAALKAGEVDQYVRVPADYVTSGAVTVYDRNFQILRGGGKGIGFGSTYEWTLDYLINANLTGDEKLVAVLRNPTPGFLAERHVVNPPPESEENDQALARVVASVIPYLFYFIALVGSGYLMRSVVAEKENRTAEVLLLSLHPRELMLGKILGLSVVTALQLAVWAGGGMLTLNRSANWLNVSQYSFPSGFFVWAALFMVLGFLLYASVMAAAGAVAPTAREGSQVTWLLIVPLMPTLMFGPSFLEEPHGTLPLVLSLIPFSAPGAMVTRLAVADVPLWQPIVSLLGLAALTYLFVALAGRFFRAGNLLSQASFNWRRLATGWRQDE